MKALVPLLLLCAAVLPVLVSTDTACAAGEACHEYVREDKAYGARVKADLKRIARSRGVPERLMYLYDQLGDCPYCLDGNANAPIMPYIYIVYAKDAHVRAGGLRNVRVRGTDWSAEEEYGARQGMRDGYVEAYYILLETTKCECCRASTEEELDEWDDRLDEWDEEEPYRDEPGWNDELEIDTSRSDAHESVDELGPDPADLTEIDDKDRYPDELPVPDLELPPPVRPMTTGCSACQDIVNQYNDFAVRINEQNRVVAMAERRLKIGGIAIRFAWREIFAHERKAQNEAWAAEYDRLWRRLGDLFATSQSDQRALDNARAARMELLAQLAALRRTVIECEERCRLLDEQAPPTTDPEPPPDPVSNDADTALPPYVRIASQVCSQCTEALERRNAIARDMNELVQGMIDAGVNENSIKAWEAMRAELDTANEALRECAERCEPQIIADTEVLMSGESFTGDIESCPPCRELQERYDYWKGEEWKAVQRWYRYRLAVDRLIQEKYQAGGELSEREREEVFVSGPQPAPDASRLDEIELRINQLREELEKRHRALKRIRETLHQAALRLRHCIVTRCGDGYDYQPDTRYPEIRHYSNPEIFFRIRDYFFVSTSCENCRDQVRSINAWVMQAHEEWMTHEFLDSLSDYRGSDNSAVIAARLKLLEFLSELEERLETLRDCEKRFCPTTHGDPTQDAYQEPNIASDQCLDDTGTRTAAESGDTEALPQACEGSWLHRLLLACEDDSCAGTGDVAVRTDALTDAECLDRSVPIGGLEYSDPEVSLEDRLLTGVSPNGACSPPAAQVVDAGALRTSQDLASGNPNDPYFLSAGNVADAQADQWGLRRIGAYDAIAADRRHAVTGHSVVVAVIDSGLDIFHPDMRNRVWSNGGELPANGVDDDGNGFIDDVHGWNFVGNDNDVRDHNGHGTMVAGIIGAVPDNGVGIAGVNPWTKIMPLKVTNFLGRGNSIDIAAAITYAVSEGADVINISLGGPEFSMAERAAVDYAASRGILIVVAAGNEGTDAAAFWPAALENVITVAATEADDVRARYSNWGSPVDVAAPGSNILSLRARHTDLMYFVEDDYARGRNIIGEDRSLYHASGTSFAAPFVTGIASLIRSLRQDLDAAAIRRMVLHSAADIETPGIDALTGFGVVDAQAALAADPEFFVDAAIAGVSAKREDGQVFVQVNGMANADRFNSAVLYIGASRDPGEWQSAGDPVLSPVENGVIAEIDAAEFSGSPTWTLRLEVTHENGTRREARFELNLQ